MSSELVKSTNSLPFLKESEKDYWNKLLDSNIRAGTMACMWCMKAQLVKKTSLAFHRWKFVVARQSWYNNSSPSKSIQNTASRATSSSPPQSTEKLLNHAGARPVSAVLANAMQLVNTLKESDAERDVNTRLFASPSASVKAANAAATSVLELDSKTTGTVPAGHPWERRRRAGSHGSIDTESGFSFEGSVERGSGEGHSAETLSAHNKQRLAYVLRSILPNGGAAGADQQSYAVNLDGTRRSGQEVSPGYAGEDELNAYLRHALLSQNHDATTRGQILMALSQNMVNRPNTATHNNNNNQRHGDAGDHPSNNDTDQEVSARSSLSLLRVSGSNPPAALNTSLAFPRARANSRTGSPNARLSRKSFDSYPSGGAGGSVGGGSVGGNVYHEYTHDTNTNSDRPYHTANNTTSSHASHHQQQHSYAPETPDAYHSRTYPSSAAASLHPGGSVSGHSLHSEFTSYTNNNSHHHGSYSSNTSINTTHNSSGGKKGRAVPGYLMPTNSFRKKQSSAGSGPKSGGIGSGRARSPGMITSSTSKHAAVQGSTSPTAYTVKGSSGGSLGNSGGRSGSAGRHSGDGGGVDNNNSGNNNNVYYASASGSASRATTPSHNHHPSHINNSNNNYNNTNNNTSTNNNATATNPTTSYANLSFLDYQARKAGLTSGQRSPVRRNSANIDTSRINSSDRSNGVSVFGDEDEQGDALPLPPSASQPPLQVQMPPLALAPQPLASPPLPLSEPVLPLSLQSQTSEGPTADLVYAVYDSYHNSTLHSNSSDLYEQSLHNNNSATNTANHTLNNTTINTSMNSHDQSHRSGGGEYVYGAHSPSEQILFRDDTAYGYNDSHPHTTHTAHNTHSQPFVANATNTLRPTTTDTTTTTHTSSTTSGKRSNPGSGGKSKPKGMDKAQLELMMYGDVHGRAPNWHKTLRN